MDRLDGIAERARLYLDGKNSARDVALARSRELIRYCANTIRATHRGEFGEAENLLATARQAAANMVAGLEAHPDLYHAGYTQDALKEFAEASITFCLITDRPLPTPEELDVLPDTYLNGLGEAAGELRRYVLDVVRHGRVERCESMLQAMEDIYSLLVTMDYPDAVTSGLRRTTDMVRGVLERTRGDLTVATRQDSLQRALADLERKVGSSSDGGWPTGGGLAGGLGDSETDSNA